MQDEWRREGNEEAGARVQKFKRSHDLAAACQNAAQVEPGMWPCGCCWQAHMPDKCGKRCIPDMGWEGCILDTGGTCCRASIGCLRPEQKAGLEDRLTGHLRHGSAIMSDGWRQGGQWWHWEAGSVNRSAFRIIQTVTHPQHAPCERRAICELDLVAVQDAPGGQPAVWVDQLNHLEAVVVQEIPARAAGHPAEQKLGHQSDSESVNDI
eukprot:364508-Chlamydomonas_euryale.AAC.14